MIKKEIYSGGKFRFFGTETTYTIYGEKVEKDIFIPTKGYLKFLDEQRKQEERKNFEKLKQKLIYQYQQFGEVDEVELELFNQLLKKYQTQEKLQNTKFYKG